MTAPLWLGSFVPDVWTIRSHLFQSHDSEAPSENIMKNEGLEPGGRGGRSLWHQIGEALSSEILQGKYEPGGKLPTEPELMERFGVARFTVRQAMADLEHRGLVRIVRGRGTFVNEDLLSYQLSERTRFSQNLLAQGREPGGYLVRIEEGAASPEVSQALKLAPGDLVVRTVGVGLSNDSPICFGEDYYPASRFPDLVRVGKETGGTTEIYKRAGIIDYLRLITWISARPPTDDEARYLRQPRSRPVLVTRKIDVEPNGVPIGYSDMRWASDRVQFVLDNSAQLVRR